MIPDEAVEAAARVLICEESEMLPIERLRLALEAAAPHLMADTHVFGLLPAPIYPLGKIEDKRQ